MSRAFTLDQLAQQHPEWLPWLNVVRRLLRELDHARWNQTVPSTVARAAPNAPLLAGASLHLQLDVFDDLFSALLDATRDGPTSLTYLRALPAPSEAASAAVHAILAGDETRIDAMAGRFGADAPTYRAIAALVPRPFLHACSRRHVTTDQSYWPHGYCPLCGHWPAFANECGVERNRYLRCGQCGTSWLMRCLVCPYCGMEDHSGLGALLPKQLESHASIDTCQCCLGYLKVITTLRLSTPAQIVVEDLATVALDWAAAERGYLRPNGVGYVLGATIREGHAV